jgi:hypothetical protein
MSGPIPEAPGETWVAVDSALRQGLRGLPGGTSLARRLCTTRPVPNRSRAPHLTEEVILRLARAYHHRHERWPVQTSGNVVGAPGETWYALDSALRHGTRGLPGGSSLAKLLAENGLKRHRLSQPQLTFTRILRWADAHRELTGAWPTEGSGRVWQARGETWSGINAALRQGSRGLPKGWSLARLLAARRGHRPGVRD